MIFSSEQTQNQIKTISFYRQIYATTRLKCRNNASHDMQEISLIEW